MILFSIQRLSIVHAITVILVYIWSTFKRKKTLFKKLGLQDYIIEKVTENKFTIYNTFTMIWVNFYDVIRGVLRDLVPFVQFKKGKKHPWRSVTFSKNPATLLKVTQLCGCFSRFLNCTNVTKSHKTSYIWSAPHRSI